MEKEKYQVIARKFRPKTFEEVVGQEIIVTTLKNALRFKRLAHAYLFCGTRGTGKTTLARLFAKALNCRELTADQEPCNNCPSCLEIASGHSLDVLEIDGASNRGIDDIRHITETIGYAPATGQYKIYLIDEVHMLTKEAFNALLKTLEEPPPHVKFFFATTEPHKVLPTIISRCQRFDLSPISSSLIKEKLQSIVQQLNGNVETEALTLIAAHAEGSLRDAESLLDQLLCYTDDTVTAAMVSASLGLIPNALLFDLDRAIYDHNLSFAFNLAHELCSKGHDIPQFLDALMDHLRQILLIKLGESPTSESYKTSASYYSQEQCLALLDYLIIQAQQLARTAFKRVSLEIILLHVLRSRQRLSLDALVKRLIDLEGKIVSIKQEAPVAAPIKQEEPIAESPLPFEKKKPAPPPTAKYETLLRFASVELEATLKKD